MEINSDYKAIRNYLEGKLDSGARHAFEKRMLDDPFLADALEGYTLSKLPSDSQLSILQRQLEEHIALQQEKKNVLHFSWQRLSIAAAAGLMFITAGILFWLKHFHTDTSVKQKTVQVDLSAMQAVVDSQKLSENSTAYYTDIRIQPESGWEAYGEYLKKNIHRSEETQKGDVLVSFDINPQGIAENIRIVKGIGKASNSDAIRLIKEGPKWLSGTPEKRSGIQIRIKF